MWLMYYCITVSIVPFVLFPIANKNYFVFRLKNWKNHFSNTHTIPQSHTHTNCKGQDKTRQDITYFYFVLLILLLCVYIQTNSNSNSNSNYIYILVQFPSTSKFFSPFFSFPFFSFLTTTIILPLSIIFDS